MTKLTLQIGNRTLSAQDLAEDLTYKDMLELFVGLMVGQTYSEEGTIRAMKSYEEA